MDWTALGWTALLATLLLLPVTVLASPRQDSGPLRSDSSAHHKDAVHYKYQYAVDDPASGVVNDRWEQRNGDFVKGQYSLLDPDGKVRTVDYEVDGERGFHAVIRTQYPAPSLLSIQSASQVHEVYQDSPVNIRAKNGLDIPPFVQKNPRFSVRDNLPFNYHALDAAKLGINTEDDGAQLQLLDLDEGPLSAKEAQRRKYHRENHLLPHERLLQHELQDDFQDQSIQQDTRQDLQGPIYDPIREYNRDLYSTGPGSSASVFNPRAAYISLRPRPSQSPLPPPNPPPLDVLLSNLRRSAPPQPSAINSLAGRAPASGLVTSLSSPSSAPGFLFQPQLQQLQQVQQVRQVQRLQQVHSAASLAPGLQTLAILRPQPVARSSSRRIVQHLTETSPGLSARRSYYLR